MAEGKSFVQSEAIDQLFQAGSRIEELFRGQLSAYGARISRVAFFFALPSQRPAEGWTRKILASRFEGKPAEP